MTNGSLSLRWRVGTEKKSRAQREDKDNSMASTENSNTGNGGSLAARRARLRGSLARASLTADPFVSGAQAAGAQYSSPQETPEPYPESYSQPEDYQKDPESYNVYGVPIEPPQPSASTAGDTDPLTSALSDLSAELSRTGAKPAPVVEPEPFEPVPSPQRRGRGQTSSQATSRADTQSPPKQDDPPAPAPNPAVPAPPPHATGVDAPVEFLNNIDSALSTCATNLQALQNLSREQYDVLKSMNSSLANQTMMEIGLNLNSLTESLTAALEPMKAMGELIPALDQLILTLEGKEAEKGQKLSPDDLVTSLADQLSAGLIDPWTFKCAYMAVYPADHPADLLHRLVELLGTQRLSGDLFRAAYEAVQAAEPPPRLFPTQQGASGEVVRSIPDEAIKAQLDALAKSNDDLQKRQEERERELTELLSQKERELQNAQDLLNQKLEELNVRYEDSATALSSREDEFRAVLESKEMELIEKESELNMLRTQMEELRTNMQDLVKDLQGEMQKMREERIKEKEEAAARGEQKPAAAPGFFDSAPQQPRNLFEAAPAPKPLFATETQPQPGFGDNYGEGFVAPQPVQPNMPQPGQFGPIQATQQLPVMQPAPQPAPVQQPAMQQSPQPVQSGFGAPTAFQAPQQPVFQPPQPQQQPQQQQQQSAPRPGPAPAPATTPLGTGGPSGPGSYGSGVRAQVFEVIVRQALAGAPWREICAGPMQVNNITPDEVEAEVKRRQQMLGK